MSSLFAIKPPIDRSLWRWGGESWGSRAGRAPCYRGRLLPLLFLSQIVRFWLILWLQRASDSSQDSVKSDLL